MSYTRGRMTCDNGPSAPDATATGRVLRGRNARTRVSSHATVHAIADATVRTTLIDGVFPARTSAAIATVRPGEQ